MVKRKVPLPPDRSTPPHPAWRSYRVWRTAMWALFFSYLPGVTLIGGLVRQFTSSDRAVVVVAFVWMVAYALCGIRVGSARCPRCRNRLHMGRSGVNPFSRRCLHCGIQVGQDPAPADDATSTSGPGRATWSSRPGAR